jgi:hypothetical protein
MNFILCPFEVSIFSLKGGEKVKSVSIGIVTVFAFLMIFAAVLPVMAAPEQKIPVTAVTSNQVNGTPEAWTTDGGITHSMYTRTGTITLTIDGQAPIVGTLSEVAHSMINTKTGKFVGQNFDCVWTFTGGSFEGTKQTRITADANGKYLTLEQHVVFQGSGVFDGYTMKLTQEAPPFPPIYTGSLLIH